MQLEIKPGANNMYVPTWSATNPTAAIAFIRALLRSAKAIWPSELKQFDLVERKPRKKK